MATVRPPLAGAVAPTKPTVVPPLVPVVLSLVITAIALSVIFARLFPAPTRVAPVVRLTESAVSVGLNFSHFAAVGEPPTTIGGAVAVFDFDADGDPDVFFVNGAPWPWEESLMKRAQATTCALFRNDGGTFTDVTARAGLNVELQGMAAAAGDFDADGRVDLFVTGVGANHLFRNRGDGRFEDVTEEARVGGDDHTWSTAAAWIDYDGDRRLDLIVAHYAHWSPEAGLAAALAAENLGRSYGTPTGFVSAFPSVYRNLGDGRFTVVADGVGLRDVDAQTGLPVAKPLAIVPNDANGDGRLDLMFAYAAHPSALFVNRGDGTFRKWTGPREERHEGASAGIPSVYARGGEVDEVAATLRAASAWNEANAERATSLAGKFGAVAVDLDLDGSLEIFSSEGRLERSEDPAGVAHALPRVWWHEGGRWEEARSLAAGTALPGGVRGVATLDFDGDGDLDVVAAQHAGPALLWRNEQRGGLPWLRIRLEATRGAADAARVEVHTPRRVFLRSAAPLMGFMAQSESVLTFGLGEDARVRRVVVHWPSGVRQEVRPEGLNRELVIREP